MDGDDEGTLLSARCRLAVPRVDTEEGVRYTPHSDRTEPQLAEAVARIGGSSGSMPEGSSSSSDQRMEARDRAD